MKKTFVFILGFILGIAFTIISALIIAGKNNTIENGMRFFEQPGKCLSMKPFKVMQVIDNNYALAHEVEWNKGIKEYTTTDLLVLVTNDNGEYYYDGQVIKIPKGKCMRQIGVYKYQTRMEIEKTVPIVKLMKK